MNTTIVREETPSFQLRIKGAHAEIPTHQWACLRFLEEDEVIDLLRERLGKSEVEVREVLDSYDRATLTA